MNKRQSKYGITFLEIVIVLALLCILFTILWPILPFSQRGESYETICLRQVRVLAIASTMYCQDNHGCFPDINWASETRQISG